MANNNSGIVFIIIAVSVGVVLATYFLLKILFAIGLALVFISVILLAIGIISQESKMLSFSLIFLVIGITCVAIGHEGVSFFEENPTGANLLNASNSIVNATKEGVGVYSEITQIENQAKRDIITQTSTQD